MNYELLKKGWTRNRLSRLGGIGAAVIGIVVAYSWITSGVIVIDNRVDWRELLGFSEKPAQEKPAPKKTIPSGVWLDTNFNWRGLDPATYEAPGRIYPRGLNLLFIADEFGSFGEFKGAVDKIWGAMKQTEPWKSHSEINPFLIYQNNPALCEVKEENQYAPVLKCGEGLIKLGQTLPLVQVKVIVVSREPFVSWANLTRFENSFVFYSMPESKENDPFNL